MWLCMCARLNGLVLSINYRPLLLIFFGILSGSVFRPRCLSLLYLCQRMVVLVVFFSRIILCYLLGFAYWSY